MYKSYSSLNQLCYASPPAKTNNEKFLPVNDKVYFNPVYDYPQIIKIRKETHRLNTRDQTDFETQATFVKEITQPESIKAYRSGNKEKEVPEPVKAYQTGNIFGASSNCPNCPANTDLKENLSICASCMNGGKECSDCDNRLDPIMDPRYNLREVAKQLILLQDHLAIKKKRCLDCISKHILTTEALLEEAITLDKSGQY